MLTVGDVAALLRVAPLAGDAPERTIDGAHYDSRKSTPDSLFVALRGEGARDGWEFVPSAVERGAVAVLAERPPAPAWLARWGDAAPAYFVVPNSLWSLGALAAAWRSRHRCRAISITGAVGKTSAKDALASVLDRRFPTLKNDSSLNNEIGVPVTLLRLTRRHERLVQELGTYGPGEVTFLCSMVRPITALVTNIGPSHLERMGTLENIARCEGEVVECLPPDGVACLNFDDPLVAEMAGRCPGRVVTYGVGVGADLRATDVVERGLAGVEMRLHWRGEAVAARVPIAGKPGLWTALGVAAVALVEGLALAEIASGLMALPGASRLHARAGRHGSTVLDDHYNASPVSVGAALDVLVQTPPTTPTGRRVVILADMLELGPIEEQAHREMGARIAGVADALVAVGPLASRYVADEAARRGLADIATFGDAAEVVFEPQPGDVILVKGSRGMYMERMVAKLVELQSPK